jgi:hypothetical protein
MGLSSTTSRGTRARHSWQRSSRRATAPSLLHSTKVIMQCNSYQPAMNALQWSLLCSRGDVQATYNASEQCITACIVTCYSSCSRAQSQTNTQAAQIKSTQQVKAGNSSTRAQAEASRSHQQANQQTICLSFLAQDAVRLRQRPT